MSSDATLRQRAGLRATIERRSTPTPPTERVPLVAPPINDHKRGHVDASLAGTGARIPEGASEEYRRGWRAGLLDRYCVESVGARP